MPQPFLPLAAPGSVERPGQPPSRLKVVSAAKCQPQKLGDKLSLAAATAPSTPAPGAGSTPAAPAAPTVEVVRERDQIKRIQVRCSCGELIELECTY